MGVRAVRRVGVDAVGDLRGVGVGRTNYGLPDEGLQWRSLKWRRGQLRYG